MLNGNESEEGQTLNAAKDMLEAVRAQQSGRLDEAADAYRRILEADPKEADALNNLGIIFAQRGDFAAASDCLARALEVRPDSSETRSNLANLYVKLGRTDEAAETYRKALDANPQNVDALNNLGVLYEKQGRHAEAAYYWERQHELNPTSADAMTGLARNRRASGLHQQAMELYWSAGMARLNRREFADALTCYTDAVTIDPEQAPAIRRASASRSSCSASAKMRCSAIAGRSKSIRATPRRTLDSATASPRRTCGTRRRLAIERRCGSFRPVRSGCAVSARRSFRSAGAMRRSP